MSTFKERFFKKLIFEPRTIAQLSRDMNVAEEVMRSAVMDCVDEGVIAPGTGGPFTEPFGMGRRALHKVQC